MRLHILASAVIFGIGAAALAVSAEGEDRREETFRQLELFGDVLSRIESDYVVDPDKAELIESAINGMLSSLDPHSSYLNPDDFEDMQDTIADIQRDLKVKEEAIEKLYRQNRVVGNLALKREREESRTKFSLVPNKNLRARKTSMPGQRNLKTR